METRMPNVDDEDDNGNTTVPPGGDWRDYFQRGRNGQVLTNLRNTAWVVKHDHKFQGVHWFNEMTRSEVLRNGNDNQYYLVDDVYFINTQHYIQENHSIRTVGIDNVRHAILADCHLHKYHPVRKGLSSLKWDKKERIVDWTVKYLGAESSPYNCAIGAMFLVSMVARILKPGCKCDHMMVLEGEQGIGKSTVCKILFGQYFSDYLPDISTKDACDHVSKFWGIEIAEMHVFNRAETAALKSFISRTHEQYRPPYGRMEVTWPRQCVFMGTTNQELYLKDETGGRRFWPVKCGTIDLDALKRDRNQLLAEAFHCFGQGWNWWPDRHFEQTYIKPEQTKRQEFDEWQNIIKDNFSAIIKKEKTTVKEIYQVVLAMGVNKLPSAVEASRISKILKGLGGTYHRDGKGRYWNLSKVTLDTE